MRDTWYAVGADSGASAAWALVELGPRGLRLLNIWPVYGDGKHWMHRARLGASSCWNGLLDACDGAASQAVDMPVWIETPPQHSRKLENGKRHSQQSWTGLGRRVGQLEVSWFAATAEVSTAELVEPTAWWDPWRGQQLRRGKNEMDGGEHRVTEAGNLVAGAASALALVPSSRRVDVAESILIAGAAAIVVRKEDAERTMRARLDARAAARRKG